MGAIRQSDTVRFQDDPWRRLPWLTALALPLTLTTLMGFLGLLEHQQTVSRAWRPIDVQVVELPRTTIAPSAPPEPKRTRTAPPIPKKVAPPPKPRADVKLPPPPVPEPPIEPPPEPAPSAASEVAPPPAPAPEAAPIAPPVAPPPSSAPPAVGDRSPPPPVTSSVPSPSAVSGMPSGTDLGGGRMGARVIFKPLPEIPDALRHRTVELVAVARFRVAASGAAQVDLITPTSDADLNRALLETLKRWRFFPAMQDGKPVASTLDIRIPISVR